MLMPRKTRFRKQQRGRTTGVAKGGSTLVFGDFGIQVLERGGAYYTWSESQSLIQFLFFHFFSFHQ